MNQNLPTLLTFSAKERPTTSGFLKSPRRDGGLSSPQTVAKSPAKGGKLPALCKEHKITHVILSSALHRKKTHEKVAALLFVWDQLEALGTAPPGSRFILRLKQVRGSDELRIALQEA